MCTFVKVLHNLTRYMLWTFSCGVWGICHECVLKEYHLVHIYTIAFHVILAFVRFVVCTAFMTTLTDRYPRHSTH